MLHHADVVSYFIEGWHGRISGDTWVPVRSIHPQATVATVWNVQNSVRALSADGYDRLQGLATVIEALYARGECAAVV